MRKILFLIGASLFTSCFSCFEPLSADDFLRFSDLDQTKISETVLKPVEIVGATPIAETPATPVNLAVSEVSTAPASAPEIVSEAPLEIPTTPVAEPPAEILGDCLAFNGRKIPLTEVDSTDRESGDGVNKINKLIYGHNSASVFAGLDALTAGATFTISLGGAETTYRVFASVIYDKNPDGRLQLNGKGSYMKAIRDRASYNNTPHDLALMTCAGISYGNGDASQRLVIFADAI